MVIFFWEKKIKEMNWSVKEFKIENLLVVYYFAIAIKSKGYRFFF